MLRGAIIRANSLVEAKEKLKERYGIDEYISYERVELSSGNSDLYRFELQPSVSEDIIKSEIKEM